MGPGTSRTRSSGTVFGITQGEVDGGGSARSLGHSIPTGGGPFDDVRRDVRDAGDHHHYDESMQRPNAIRLHFVRDEIVLGFGGWRDVR